MMSTIKKKYEKTSSNLKPPGKSKIIGEKSGRKLPCKIPIKSPGSKEKSLPLEAEERDKKVSASERGGESNREDACGDYTNPIQNKDTNSGVYRVQDALNTGQTQTRLPSAKKQKPRRHTLTEGAILDDNDDENKETAKKRDAFMDLLAKRYPRYADKISISVSEDGFPVRGRRPRDHNRRATVVTYNPLHNRSMEYNDSGTMSDSETPTNSFQRGGSLRSSMPIVRSPPNTFEKPLGLVFLIFNNETKKAVLPNEITHLDTVRAMFVRSFPAKLSMEYMESPRRRIYILDPRTSIYYQLEDLRDVKDRTVLRIHECKTNEPQKVLQKPEVRGRPVQRADVRFAHSQEAPANAITTQVLKTQSLPPNVLRSYPPPPVAYMDDSEIGRMWPQAPNLVRYASPMDVHESNQERPRSLTPNIMTRSYPPPLIDRDLESERGRSQTPEPRKTPRPQNLNYGSRVSPDRMTTPERPSLHSIPENRQIPGNSNTYSNYENIGGFQPYRVSSNSHHPHYPPQSKHLMQQPRSLSPPSRRPMSPPMQQPSRRAFSPPAVPTHNNYQYLPPPVPPPQTYIAKSVRAATGISPQHALLPADQRDVPPSRNSLPFVPPQQHPEGRPAVLRSQSYRVTPERDAAVFNQRPRSVTPQPMDFETKTRIDKMEVQLANLAHFVQTTVKKPHPSSGYGSGSGKPGSGQSSSSIASNSTGTFPSSTASSLSDIASDTTQQTVKQDIKTTISTLKGHADGLKKDLKNIRRIQQLNNESMQEQFQECLKKIQHALISVPGAEQQPLRQRRSEVNCQQYNYLEDFIRIDKELSDLEASVEELRSDVISRQCRVNQTDVECLALVLSNVTKCLGEMKVKFPALQEEMKSIMAGEMEIVIHEERFLKEEPEKLENSLKRCKKLTGTLFTLKRLSSVQEHRSPQVPNFKPLNREAWQDEKKTLLCNIQSLVPNHTARLESIKAEKTYLSAPVAADASRERKKKIITQQEALKFGKSLEIASKALKPTTNDKDPKPVPSQRPLFPAQASRPTIPLTSTIKKISNIDPTCSKSAAGTSTVTLIKSGPTMMAPASVTASTFVSVPSVNTNNTDNEYVKKTSENKLENVIPAPENRIGNLMSSPESNIEDGDSNSPNGEKDKSLTDQKTAARAAFFSSLASPSSPSNDHKHSAFSSPSKTSSHTTTSPTKSNSFAMRYNFAGNQPGSTSSVIKSSSQTSHIPAYENSKPSTLAFAYSSRTKEGSLSPSRPTAGALIRSQSNSSAIPRYQSSTDSVKKKMSPPVNYDSKPKKVPPPPPPRKSSKMTFQGPPSPTSSSVNGSVISPVRPMTPSSSESVNQNQKQGNISIDISVCSTNIPMSSTPKTDGSQKPATVFEQGLVTGLYSNLKKPEEEKIRKSEVIVTNLNNNKKVMTREEREGSSDSSTSSSSLDSQQGAVWVKRESANGDVVNKLNKPSLPERKSSLISKSQTESSSAVNGNIKSKQSSPCKDLPVS